MELGRLRAQTRREEVANSISHGLGAVLSLIGAIFLITRGIMSGSAITAISLAAYGFSLVLLYSSSAIYHGVKTIRIKAFFQIMDHCSIYLLILGTYIPMSLLVIGGKLGWALFLTNTTLAVLGITLTAIDLKRFDKFSLVLYALMGWLVALALKTVFEVMTPAGAFFLVSGGVAYTVGIIFYRSNRSFMHLVWHLFVLAGSVLQYVCILISCL